MRDRMFYPVVLTLLAGIGVAYSLVPGITVQPSPASQPEVIAGLVSEKSRLQEAIRSGCNSTWLRDSFVSERSLSRSAPGTDTASDKLAGGYESSTSSLTKDLDRAVVLIVGKGSIGTGFFITPTLIVTNRHVVDSADDGAIFVTNKLMGRVEKATVVARSNSNAVMQADFAVLRIPSAVAGTGTLKVATNPERLAPVVAAGFPGAIVSTDAALRDLMQGDHSRAPETVLTIGEVSTVQPQTNGIGLIIHTAEISPGNSGGPLVDRCGRVVGINTFVRQAKQSDSKILYSLSAEALQTFLKSKQLPFESAVGSCGTGTESRR